MTVYALEVKLEAVQLSYEEGLTQGQVTATLGIRDPKRSRNG